MINFDCCFRAMSQKFLILTIEAVLAIGKRVLFERYDEVKPDHRLSKVDTD